MKLRLNLVLGLVLLTGFRCVAQYNPFLLDAREDSLRSQRGEFYMLGQYFHAEPAVIRNITLPIDFPPTTYATSDLKFDFEDDALWGFGMAYHINNHFAVRAEFLFGYPDYQATWNGRVINGESWVQEGRFNLDYHLLDGPFTPYVSGGLGYFFVDTGIPDGPPELWWDYWWGYVATQPTYTETYFTLNAAVGLRWDVNEQFFIKAEGTTEWIEMSGDWVQSIRATLAAGWKF